MSCQPSFAQFLETDAGRKACDPQFIDRLGHADVQIKSLTQLLKFANERWPEHYPANSAKTQRCFFCDLSMGRRCGAYGESISGGGNPAGAKVKSGAEGGRELI